MLAETIASPTCSSASPAMSCKNHWKVITAFIVFPASKIHLISSSSQCFENSLCMNRATLSLYYLHSLAKRESKLPVMLLTLEVQQYKLGFIFSCYLPKLILNNVTWHHGCSLCLSCGLKWILGQNDFKPGSFWFSFVADLLP